VVDHNFGREPAWVGGGKTEEQIRLQKETRNRTEEGRLGQSTKLHRQLAEPADRRDERTVDTRSVNHWLRQPRLFGGSANSDRRQQNQLATKGAYRHVRVVTRGAAGRTIINRSLSERST
jgi:hypothetical protein